MTKFEQEVRRRYFRKVIAHPTGAVVHDGDCDIYSSMVCTCGLLHYLRPHMNAPRIYPRVWVEVDEQEVSLEVLRQRERRRKK